MPLCGWGLSFRILGSVGAVFGAALLLLFPDGVGKKLLPGVSSFATGILLEVAFLGAMPEALEHAQPLPI